MAHFSQPKELIYGANIAAAVSGRLRWVRAASSSPVSAPRCHSLLRVSALGLYQGTRGTTSHLGQRGARPCIGISRGNPSDEARSLQSHWESPPRSQDRAPERRAPGSPCHLAMSQGCPINLKHWGLATGAVRAGTAMPRARGSSSRASPGASAGQRLPTRGGREVVQKQL